MEKLTVTKDEIKVAEKKDEIKQLRLEVLGLKKALALILGGYGPDVIYEKTDKMINFKHLNNYLFGIAKSSFEQIITPKAEDTNKKVEEKK